MELRVSEYNFFVPRPEGGGIIYNAACGSFTYVDSTVFDALRHKELPALSESHLTDLAEAGIIETGGQKDHVLQRFELERAARSRINLTIAPTIECNYACWYCYQNERRVIGTMSSAVQKGTLRFIDCVVQSRDSFGITWFGGEPLLALDVIEGISRELRRRYASSSPKLLSSGIVTNGILLNDDVVATLNRCDVTSAQLSVDSYLHLPPTRRGVCLPDGTLSPIIGNALKYRKQLDFTIRINTSSIERGDIERIVDTLKLHGLSELTYFARVEDNVTECNKLGPVKTNSPSSRMSRKEYADTKATFTKREGLQKYVNEAQRALRPKSHFCGATAGNMYVIDFRGDVSRCWISVGRPEEKIGNVMDIAPLPGENDVERDQIFANSDIDRKWREYNPLQFDECRKCHVLPLCMGGCSHARVLHGAVRPPCEDIKFNISRYVTDIASRLPLPG